MNAPAHSATRTVGISTPDHSIVPLLSQAQDKVQYYFQQLYAADTLKYRFSDLDNPQWLDVLEVIQRMGQGMYLVLDCDSNLVAEFTLESFTGQSAQLHFCMHPDIDIQEKLVIARHTLEHILLHWINPSTRQPFLKSVYGLTPIPNRVACIFALKAGFKKLGILPGGCTYMGKTEDAMISVATNG